MFDHGKTKKREKVRQPDNGKRESETARQMKEIITYWKVETMREREGKKRGEWLRGKASG